MRPRIIVTWTMQSQLLPEAFDESSDGIVRSEGFERRHLHQQHLKPLIPKKSTANRRATYLACRHVATRWLPASLLRFQFPVQSVRIRIEVPRLLWLMGERCRACPWAVGSRFGPILNSALKAWTGMFS